MRVEDYIATCDVIGADAVSRVVVVRPRDVGGVVRAKGGAPGAVAFSLAPELITNRFYEQLVAKLRDGFKQEDVDVDVYVAAAPLPPSGLAKSDLFGGALIGASGAAALYGLLRLINHFVRRR